jgi:hypothetical protein
VSGLVLMSVRLGTLAGLAWPAWTFVLFPAQAFFVCTAGCSSDNEYLLFNFAVSKV